jgi:hypothetical protein
MWPLELQRHVPLHVAVEAPPPRKFCGQGSSRPMQKKETPKYLHTTNSQTEEEVGGSETKQLDAKIHTVKITACKDSHMFVMKNQSLRV